MNHRPKHLIIPDAHAHPKYDNERFKALGRLIAEERPDNIICIGDWADMPSLSSYDKGKLQFEGRKYQKDIDAAVDAQEKLFNQVSKAKKYKPEWWMMLGNHDARIEREVADNPNLDGKLSVSDLRYENYGWKVFPFLEPLVLDGVAYAHYFAGGVSGRPISGENIAKSLCNKLHVSAVQGHSHIFDHSERTRVDGQKIFGMSVGCFTHPDMIENWSRSIARMWWRGIVILSDLDGNGYYDEIRTITLRKILRDYL